MSKDSPLSTVAVGIVIYVVAEISGSGVVASIPYILGGAFVLWVAAPFYRGLRI